MGKAGRPHFVIEVGGRTKSVAASIREMTQHPLPAGFVPIVVRLVEARTRRPDAAELEKLSCECYDSINEHAKLVLGYDTRRTTATAR